MPHLVSPHDNTSDAREALWNRYCAFKLVKKPWRSMLKKPRRSMSGSPSSSSQKGFSPRRGNAQQGNAIPGARAFGVEAYENCQPRRPLLAQETLWFGIEPDIEAILIRWKCSNEHVNGAIRVGIQEFEEAKEIGKMSLESKAALVCLVANEMLQGHLSPSDAKPLQIQYFLSQLYRDMVKEDPHFAVPRGDHWILGSIRDRTRELEWLKFQGGLWARRAESALESQENAMLKLYTYHFDCPLSDEDVIVVV